MTDTVKQILARQIQVADLVTKAADEAKSFKQDCQELKAKTEKLSGLLRQAARASNDLYERPTRRIVDDIEQVLDKALAFVTKCRANGLMKRVFNIIPAAAFRKTSVLLENSIGDVSWLLRVSTSADNRDDEYLGLPPVAANEPILCLIWEQIATLCTGSLDERTDASASLVSLARDNDRYSKLIIEEGGVRPLLKLAKEGKPEGQENAARAIGLLGRDPESVKQIVNAGVCSVFVKILKEGHMKVQSMVAWAVSELAVHHPKCQDHFSQSNIIRFLVSHLAFETVQEHSRYTIASRQSMSIHSVLTASSTPKFEDLAIKAQLKAMAARALWQLCKGNLGICRSIMESRAMLCFANLLDKGADDVQSYSAMALMEITAVAEENAELRRSFFKPTSHTPKAVVDQSLKVIEKADTDSDSDILVPCIQAVGNLAKTFRATETRIIGPLVKLLDDREAVISMEAAIALNKFATPKNYLHVNHSKAIISAEGAKYLIQLVYFGEQRVQFPSLTLLCYIARNVPDSETLAQEEVLIALKWASKQAHLLEVHNINDLLLEAKSRLELYQSRCSRGFH